MIRFWKPRISERNRAVGPFNLAAVFLLCISSLSVAASSPQQTNAYNYVFSLKPILSPEEPPCVGQKRTLLVEVKLQVFEILGSFEKRLIKEEGMPYKHIEFEDPTLGRFTDKKPSGDSYEGLTTDMWGKASATFTAKKAGKETITFKTSWEEEKGKTINLEMPLQIIVKECQAAILINLDAKLALSGGSVTNLAVGGGQAKIDDDGQISGDGEISSTLAIALPKGCTSVETSAQSAFTIKGKMDDQTINLQFDFNDIAMPPVTTTCMGYPLGQIAGGGSGDPGDALGFHELSMSAEGDTESFPIPYAGYSGGTTVVMFMVPEEDGVSNIINPFDLLALSLPK